jgi:hypothetical protein
MPAARQNRSKLADTSSQALPTAPTFVEGNTVDVVLILFMALLSFRGISTPSLPAQGEQRRFSYFNIQRGNPHVVGRGRVFRSGACRARYRIPLERIDGRRGRAGLQHACTEGVVSVGRGRSRNGQRCETICVIVNICCSRAVYRLLREISVLIVRKSGS